MRFDIVEFERRFTEVIHRDLEIRSERIAQVDAQPIPRRIVLRVADRKGGDLFVTGVSWKDGPGWRINRFSYTGDRSKAHVFAPESGLAVARQLATRVKGVRLMEAGS